MPVVLTLATNPGVIEKHPGSERYTLREPTPQDVMSQSERVNTDTVDATFPAVFWVTRTALSASLSGDRFDFGPLLLLSLVQVVLKLHAGPEFRARR